MPRLSGWDTLQRLLVLRPGLSVILLSGGPTEGMQENAVAAGAAALLPKPFENHELLRLVRKTLDERQG
jgi:FixJ family two-component response regulator